MKRPADGDTPAAPVAKTSKATALSPALPSPTILPTASTAFLIPSADGASRELRPAVVPAPILETFDTSGELVESFIAQANDPSFPFDATMPWVFWDEVPEPEEAPGWLKKRGMFLKCLLERHTSLWL